jgi:hypothetical protein
MAQGPDVDLTCVGCGGNFRGNHQRRYCSEQCKWRTKSKRAYKPRLQGTRLCSLCKDSHYAHGLCVAHYRQHRPRVRTAEQEYVTGICTQCGTPWVKARKTSTTLCQACVVAERGSFAPNYAHMNTSSRRRAQRLGVPAEHVDVLALFEAAGWTCALCSAPVDQDRRWPDPMSPSLDHKVPLTRGGGHTTENTQLAHLGCNIRKGNRVEAAAA